MFMLINSSLNVHVNNSCGLQAVQYINCSSRYAFTNLIILRANFGCKTLQSLVVEQPIQSDYFYEVHIWCKQRYPLCSSGTFFDGHIPAWFLFLWHDSSPQIPHKLLLSCTLSESLPWVPFSLKKKKRKGESYIDWIFQCLSVYRDLYSSSSSWLAAGNSHKEEPSSVQETCCHPDQTTIQQHIFDDVVTLCSKNRKKSRKQRISECFTWYNNIVHVHTLLNCYFT